MNDLSYMAVRDCLEYLLDDQRGVFLGVALLILVPLRDPVEQLAALTELHDDVELVVCLAKLVDLKDVRVVLRERLARDHKPSGGTRVLRICTSFISL